PAAEPAPVASLRYGVAIHPLIGSSAHSSRLLMSFGIARVGAGSGVVLGRTLSSRLPTVGLVWLFHGVRPGRVPWRGVAPEGFALLEVALPVLADSRVNRARRGR